MSRPVVLLSAVVLFALQPAGRLIERRATAGDPSQTFTAYVPPGYDGSRRWPLLFVFDPRGRGTLPAKIFQPAAERYGWIIVSSDNTRSDGPWEPNARALAALWPDALARLFSGRELLAYKSALNELRVDALQRDAARGGAVGDAAARMESDPAFDRLRSDVRWTPLLHRLRRNANRTFGGTT